MNVHDVSKYLAMPVATIYSYVSLRKMPAECVVRIGRALRFEKAAIDKWISGIGSGSGDS